jgi:hypothetical protein
MKNRMGTFYTSCRVENHIDWSQTTPKEVDSAMLDDSLSMTPWERILANDDMVNFGDSLRLAMEKRNAKSR